LPSLEARVTPEQKNLIARAAASRGFGVTEFVVARTQQGLRRSGILNCSACMTLPATFL
jgi:hypothetical protein